VWGIGFQKKQMNRSYWSTETWRIALVLFIAVLIGAQSGHWLLCLSLSLASYIIWLLYKLFHLYQWLENGAKSSNMPEGNGIWEGINHQIQGMQKKSNTRKKRMGKMLKRSKIIITGLPYATVVLNDNNEIDWANKTSAKFLNIHRKLDHGQRIENLIRIPEFHELLVQESGKEIEISLAHQQEDRILTLQLTRVQKDFKLLIARDVSERVKVQKMRKNFIANASHELRTPLTVISGYLEMIQKNENLPEQLQADVSLITDQASRMQDIINDMLVLSKLENSELQINSDQIVDMPLLIHNICNEEAKLISNNKHILGIEIDSDLKITGSEVEMISVCSNLIHNAIRHTEEGTQIDVSWKKSPTTGEACFTVADNGQGIPAEDIPHLTERFYRVDKGRSRDNGGTGLGLAIAQHILQRHGGRLGIVSTLGKGSKFIAYFPAKRIV
jgi:two-component system phosphate regulon sensor histidine kinase PhoR